MLFDNFLRIMSLKTTRGEYFVFENEAYVRTKGPYLKCAERRYVNKFSLVMQMCIRNGYICIHYILSNFLYD